MGAKEKESWEVYLNGDCLHAECARGGRPYQVIIRVRPEGLQGVIKVRDGDEYLVRFEGAGTLPSLAAKIRKAIVEEVEGWRKDSFPPT